MLLADWGKGVMVKFDVCVKAANRLLVEEAGTETVGKWEGSYCDGVYTRAGSGSPDYGRKLNPEWVDGGLMSMERGTQRRHCELAQWTGHDSIAECTRQHDSLDSERRLIEDLHWESRLRQKCLGEVIAL